MIIIVCFLLYHIELARNHSPICECFKRSFHDLKKTVKIKLFFVVIGPGNKKDFFPLNLLHNKKWCPQNCKHHLYKIEKLNINYLRKTIIFIPTLPTKHFPLSQ
jgi:hypothetical protein